MRRLVWVVVLLLVGGIVATFAGGQGEQSKSASQGKSNGFVVAVSNGYFGNTWRTQFLDDMKQVADKYKQEGIISKYIVNNGSSTADQITAINSFIAQGVNAIIVVPQSATGLRPVVEKAIKQGITVVSADDADWPGAVNVVNDNSKTMLVATEWLAEQIHGKGDIVYINGIPGTPFDDARNAEVKQVLANYPDIHIVGQAPGYWTDAKANAAMTSLLGSHPHLDAVLEQDVMARGTTQAFKTAHRSIPPITGDFVCGYFKEWKSMPDLNTFTYTYPAGIGADGLKVAVKLLQGYKLKDSVQSADIVFPNFKHTVSIPIPYYVVRTLPTNNPKWAQMGDPKTKIITLDDALKMCVNKSDNTALDHVLSDSEVNALFQPK